MYHIVQDVSLLTRHVRLKYVNAYMSSFIAFFAVYCQHQELTQPTKQTKATDHNRTLFNRYATRFGLCSHVQRDRLQWNLKVLKSTHL
jgi:hypothetical protein